MPTSSKKEKISVGEIIQKALTRGENWNKTTFEKFPQVLFWLRIVIAFILGLSWAFVKLEGQLGVISYAAASSLLVFLSMDCLCFSTAFLFSSVVSGTSMLHVDK